MVLKKWEYFCFSGSLESKSMGRKVTEIPFRRIRSEEDLRNIEC